MTAQTNDFEVTGEPGHEDHFLDRRQDLSDIVPAPLLSAVRLAEEVQVHPGDLVNLRDGLLVLRDVDAVEAVGKNGITASKNRGQEGKIGKKESKVMY